MKHRLWALTLAPVLLAATPGTGFAAEGYDSCTGFIDSVPAVISKQGVWCLRADIATAITSGAAITIAANNVTIDCNDFKLGGLGAGPGSLARGIRAETRLNATIRNCAIRGFREGISLVNGGGGHLVEGNRLDGNLEYGINVNGGGNRVAHNRVLDTGGAASPVSAFGIIASADVVENTVDGVSTSFDNAHVRGITVVGYSHAVRGNIVRNLDPFGASGRAEGILVSGASSAVMGNSISNFNANIADRGIIIFGSPSPQPFCGGNTISGFATPISGGCVVAGANFSN